MLCWHPINWYAPRSFCMNCDWSFATTPFFLPVSTTVGSQIIMLILLHTLYSSNKACRGIKKSLADPLLQIFFIFDCLSIAMQTKLLFKDKFCKSVLYFFSILHFSTPDPWWWRCVGTAIFSSLKFWRSFDAFLVGTSTLVPTQISIL